MTLDDEQLSNREVARRERERDWAARRADLEDRDLVESVEAIEAYWEGVFASSARHYSSRQRWDE